MTFRRIILLCTLVLACACAKEKVAEEQDVFLTQLQPRDSILIGDQLEYGLKLRKLPEGTRIQLPDVKAELEEDLELVRDWRLDTLASKKVKGQPSLVDVKASVVLTSFEDGLYELPDMYVDIEYPDGQTDMKLLERRFVDIKTMPVDTATFVVHEIKGQIQYPVTFREVLPWLLGSLGIAGLIAGLIFLLFWWLNNYHESGRRNSEPAHIVALRKLDALRGDKLWAPEKQKQFYSGVTDVLREYMDSRYGFSAMEMTTAEIMDSLKNSDLTPELYNQLKELFERADFVKFAKHAASDEENAAAVPLAVRFVTDTYQKEIENDTESK